MTFNSAAPNEVLHLPLTLGMTTFDVVELVNAFYMFGLKPDDYENRSTYVNAYNQIAIELIPLSGDNRSWQFVNRYQTVKSEKPTLVKSIIPLIKIHREDELSLFNNIPLNTPFDILKVSDIPRKLSDLLNNYSSGYGWVSGSYGNYSTAGFSVIFNGTCVDAPTEYQVIEATARLVVVQINSGVNKGIVYLTVDPKQVIAIDSNFIGKL